MDRPRVHPRIDKSWSFEAAGGHVPAASSFLLKESCHETGRQPFRRLRQTPCLLEFLIEIPDQTSWRSLTCVMASLTQDDLQPLNRALEDKSPEELLRWAKATFGDRLAALSAMQKAGSVVCHMLHRYQIQAPVLFVDTGVMFQETLDTRDRLGREYGLEMVTLLPEETMEQQTARLGVLYLSPDGQKQCCHLRKIDPLRKARGRYDGMIGSLRRAEGGRRGGVPILAIGQVQR